MATFIMTGKYSAEAVKQISSQRTKKAQQIAKKCKGTIVSVYATLGETDLLVVAEFPGVAEAMKASVALNQALGIAFTTAPALSVDEFDKLIGGKS
jgi:uncharacterized protein with GYD domain